MSSSDGVVGCAQGGVQSREREGGGGGGGGPLQRRRTSVEFGRRQVAGRSVRLSTAGWGGLEETDGRRLRVVRTGDQELNRTASEDSWVAAASTVSAQRDARQ